MKLVARISINYLYWKAILLLLLKILFEYSTYPLNLELLILFLVHCSFKKTSVLFWNLVTMGTKPNFVFDRLTYSLLTSAVSAHSHCRAERETRAETRVRWSTFVQVEQINNNIDLTKKDFWILKCSMQRKQRKKKCTHFTQLLKMW